MRNYSSLLVVVGSLCLLIPLVLAWCLVGIRSSAFMKRRRAERRSGTSHGMLTKR